MLSVSSSFLPRAAAAALRAGRPGARLPIAPLLALMLLSACSGPQQAVEISFAVRFADESLSCDSEIAGMTLTDLRFYVHDVRLVMPDGNDVAVTLLEDPLWQNADVALLDFETGEGSCTNGTQQTNDAIRGHAPVGDYTALKFRVGVPEHLNHADPLRADAPLNYSFMHWHWRTGYKFLRTGVASADDGFWIHLGSARCEGTASSVAACRAANRPAVELPGYVPEKDVVDLHLDELVSGIDLGDGVPSDCSSGPAETECERPFAALGIDFRTGGAGGAPTVFRLGKRK